MRCHNDHLLFDPDFIINHYWSQLRVSMGPVAILWDIENCPVPGEINAEDVAGNLRKTLRVHPAVGGSVTMFAAYGDFNHFPKKVRKGCQRTGVNLIDVPNGKKDASDKAILVDMFLFALDNPPPCTIFLISGDVDFACALHKLGLRGYTIVLAIPSIVRVASALTSAGRYVWDWPSVARGKGLVPAKACQAGKCLCSGNEITGRFARQMPGWIEIDDSDPPKHDFTLPDSSLRHILKNKGYPAFQSQEYTLNGLKPELYRSFKSEAIIDESNSYLPRNNQLVNDATRLRSFEKPLYGGAIGGVARQEQNEGIELTNPGANFQTSWVERGDLGGLKQELVKLITLHGGKLGLHRVPAEYCKTFGRPFILAEYKSPKLSHLIGRMRETFLIKEKGNARTLHLTKPGVQSASKWNGTYISFPDSDSAYADEKDVDCDERQKELAGFELQPMRGKKRKQ